MARNSTTKDRILTFVDRYIVQERGGWIVDLELYVEYLKWSGSNVSEEVFFRIVEKNRFKKSLDGTYVNISWRSKPPMRKRIRH